MTPEEFIKEQGIEVYFERILKTPGVPTKGSQKWKDEKTLTIDWNVTIKKGEDYFHTEYYQGIGNLEGFQHFEHNLNIVSNREQVERLLTGVAKSVVLITKSGRPLYDNKLSIKKPKPEDALYALIMDAYAGEGSFADFCAELGYNEDSISHRDLYFECQKTSDNLQRLGIDMDTAMEVFQDY